MERADDLLRVDIRENQKQIRVAFDKMDANSKEFQASMNKLNDKIDASTRAIYEKIDAGTREFRADIRELNQDYKAHLAHHNEKAQS